jgi:hypothetical protein
MFVLSELSKFADDDMADDEEKSTLFAEDNAEAIAFRRFNKLGVSASKNFYHHLWLTFDITQPSSYHFIFSYILSSLQHSLLQSKTSLPFLILRH